MRSIFSVIAVSFLIAASAGPAAAACSLSGSVFKFDHFPTARGQLTAEEKNQLADIGAQAKAEGCLITVTAVAPRDADKQAFRVRFRQSFVARQALAWGSSSSGRNAAMEKIGRFDVKAQSGRYVVGTVYVNVN